MLKSSIKKTIRTIRKHKSKVLIISFLQILFFLTLSLIFQNTINPSMQHARNAVEYYDKINITEDSGMFGYLGEEPMVIYRSYNKMIDYIKLTVLFSILAVLFVNSSIWALTDSLVRKKKIGQFFSYIANYGIITVAAILLFYILIFKALKSSLVNLGYSLLPLMGSLMVLAALLYLLYLSYALIQKRKIKEILKITLSSAVKKFSKVIIIYLINILVIALSAFLVYLTIEAHMIFLSVTIILLILSFVFTRLFLIISVNSLIKK